MKYPEKCAQVIDVTKAPYFADNTGKTDVTDVLCRAMDDAVKETLAAVEKTKVKLLKLSNDLTEDAYLGREAGRVIDGEMTVTLPEFAPDAVILYFPAGTYLVGDTVCYQTEELTVHQQTHYECELCRHIHLLGEETEKTVIRLADHAPGFAEGKKPVISFNKKTFVGDERETTNCAQMNTLEDLTVDVGQGNPGAVGVLYASSNCGRIENVRFCGDGAMGLWLARGTEGCFRHLSFEGLRQGIGMTAVSPVILDDIDVSSCREAGIVTANGTLALRRLHAGACPPFVLEKGTRGRYALEPGVPVIGDDVGNLVYTLPENYPVMIESPREINESDCAFVTDFGAVGDGVTDDTAAIRRAMNSGKRTVLFGRGTYLLSSTVRIPASVGRVDFLWCNFSAGPAFVTGELDAVFEIGEDSEKPLFLEHLMTHEQFCGHFRFLRHAAVRDAVFHDIATVFCALYQNTVPGSRVYFDNCFQTMGTYAQNAYLFRRGYRPVLSSTVPLEFHGQRVWADNLNPERADVHVLNDASSLTLCGLKIEGPGTAVRTVNGGRTDVYLFQAGLWTTKKDNGLFETENARLSACGGFVSYFSPEENCHTALIENGERTDLLNVSRPVMDRCVCIDRLGGESKS